MSCVVLVYVVVWLVCMLVCRGVLVWRMGVLCVVFGVCCFDCSCCVVLWLDLFCFVLWCVVMLCCLPLCWCVVLLWGVLCCHVVCCCCVMV